MSELTGNSENNNANLQEVMDAFQLCQARAFAYNPNEPPEPGPKDVPLDLAVYKNAIFEANEGESPMQVIKDFKEYALFEINEWQKKNLQKKIAQKYPAGKKLLFTFIPDLSHGLPTVLLRPLIVSPRGLTSGISSAPGFYYKLVPEAIQRACSFNAPFYGNMDCPSVHEIAALKTAIAESYDHLAELLG